MTAYFIPGMCVNCKVFHKIQLPEGYKKEYIDWDIPEEDETLGAYTKEMAKAIDVNEPFILIGYSLGGVIMQEMNRFLKPEKNILISSMKSVNEIPPLFSFANKIQFAKRFPKQLYTSNKTITNLFTHLVYDMPIVDVEACVTYTSPTYMKWAIHQITTWKPNVTCSNLYHIHGTKDQIFPYKQVENVYTIEDGDHLMVMKKANEVNRVINEILLAKV